MSKSVTLGCAALCLAAGALQPSESAAQDESSPPELLALLPRSADLWVEIPDIDALSPELAGTRRCIHHAQRARSLRP